MAKATFRALACALGLFTGCAASDPAALAPGTPETPLRATFEGRPFAPQGVIAKRDRGGIEIFLYDRAAACGTPSEGDLAGERYFDLVFEQWPMAPSSRQVDANAAGIGLNAQKKDGGTSTSSALKGYVQFLSTSPTGGTLVIHARNTDATLDGELQFVMCN